MVHKDPQRRPPAKAIISHPVFWEESRMMSFLQDVSDRVEKLHFENDPLKTLEKNGRFVVRDDWNLHVDKIISEDIRKYRGYLGASVRDLLRAFRNKVSFVTKISTNLSGNIFLFLTETSLPRTTRRSSRDSRSHSRGIHLVLD